MIDRTILLAALEGLEERKKEVDRLLADVRSRLAKETETTLASNGAAIAEIVHRALVPRRRTLSAAARLRIAAAQRKRWAAWKKRRQAALRAA